MQKLMTLVVLVACVITLRADDAKDAVKKELAKLEGKWKATSLTYNGNDSLDKYPVQFTIKGDEIAVEGGDEVKKEYAKLKMKLDPTTNPKILDFTVSLGDQKGVDILGIYEVKGDELKICVKVPGNERPDKFESAAGSSVALVVLKKQK